MSNEMLVFKLQSSEGYVDGAEYSDGDLVTVPVGTLLLSLENANITDIGLSYISKNHKLRCIDLDGTKITNKGLKHLTELENLEELWIEGTSITDEGIKYLTQIPNLKFVSISYTSISDEGIAEINRVNPGIEVHE